MKRDIKAPNPVGNGVKIACRLENEAVGHAVRGNRAAVNARGISRQS